MSNIFYCTKAFQAEIENYSLCNMVMSVTHNSNTNIKTKGSNKRRLENQSLANDERNIKKRRLNVIISPWISLCTPLNNKISNKFTWINGDEFIVHCYRIDDEENVDPGFFIYNTKTFDWRDKFSHLKNVRYMFGDLHYVNGKIWVINNINETLSYIDFEDGSISDMWRINEFKNMFYNKKKNILHHMCTSPNCNQWSLLLNQQLEPPNYDTFCTSSPSICFYWQTKEQFFLFWNDGHIYVRKGNESWSKLPSTHPLIKNMPHEIQKTTKYIWLPSTGAFDASDTYLILMGGAQFNINAKFDTSYYQLNVYDDIWIINLQTNTWQKSNISIPFSGPNIYCLMDKSNEKNDIIVSGYVRKFEEHFNMNITKHLQILILTFIDRSNIYLSQNHKNRIDYIETDKLFV